MAISERIKKVFMGNRKLDMEKVRRAKEKFERFRSKGQQYIAKAQKFATQMEQHQRQQNVNPMGFDTGDLGLGIAVPQQGIRKKKKNQNSMAGIFDV